MKDLINKVLQHKATIPASVGVASFAAGFGVCYIWQREKQWTEAFEEALEDPETEEFEKESEIVIAPPTHSPVTIAETQYDHIVKQQREEAEAQSEINVFENSAEEWDMEAEMENRTDEAPYIIHVEEFVNDELGYSQATLTYYEGDNTLADEKDVPLYDISGIAGELKFGYGSRDPNVVYVRNPKLQSEFEILRDTGHFRHEVEGLDIYEDLAQSDLKHSNHHRFNWDD